MSLPNESNDTHPFVVYVDDNFHYMDENERYKHGSFATYDEAVAACKRKVESEVSHMHKPGMSAEKLYDLYTSFGEDPFIQGPRGTADRFSAWDYADEFANKVCAAPPGQPQDDHEIDQHEGRDEKPPSSEPWLKADRSRAGGA